MLHLVALIPALPLAGFLVLLAAGRRLGDPRAGWIGTLAIFASFAVTVLTYVGLSGRASSSRHFVQDLFSWVPVGSLHVTVSFVADPLSITMALFVTGVSALIHLYAIGYMRGDRDFPKFFVYFNLFVFSMLTLVLSDNLLLTFLGWEGVGTCSYFLISYFFERDSAATAGKMAFIVNRIGDAGFLVAMFIAFTKTGSLSYEGVFGAASHLSSGTLEAISILLFVGAVGKSAQLPLSLWLADAMEGPTPVSALIHAATMVTAGVYLMARVSPLLAHAPVASTVIAVVGIATAFFGASVGTSQDDIKKVLAYSTVSQLGYMFIGIGSGAYSAAIFLMVTHAFYKALLFLGSGSVIHAMGDEQDIKKMGGLRALMPVTAATFLVGWLSIAGVPPFSGFFSKGAVLEAAYVKSPVLWAAGVATALLTAYYMGREYLLVFAGDRRWERAAAHAAEEPAGSEEAHHGAPHDAVWVMTLPLVVLAALAVAGGGLNLPFFSGWKFLEKWLDPVFGTTTVPIVLASQTKVVLAAVDGVLALAGVAIAAGLWLRAWQHPSLEPRLLRSTWGLYGAYDHVVSFPSQAIARFASSVVESRVIDGAVNGTATLVRWSGGKVRRLQTGYVRNYALLVTVGTVVVLGYLIFRAGS